MKNRQYTIEDSLQEEIVTRLSQGCARFLTNITQYKREDDGRYRWAYSGMRIEVRISEGQYKHLEEQLESRGHGMSNALPLTVNGKLLGTVFVHRPRLHGGCFLILELAEAFQYDGRVILRFAQFAGFDSREFNMHLLHIDRDPITGNFF
jgi:hypothetical protein